MVDVDGVLTDGVIAIDDRGVETKHFHVRDGMALLALAPGGQAGGDPLGTVGRGGRSPGGRAGIAHVLQGAAEKGEPFRALMAELGLEPRQVCYVGDDLADLPVLRAVGLAACPADAVAEVRDAAHLVTAAAGGRGAFREVVEVILKSQGLWDGLCETYTVPAV